MKNNNLMYLVFITMIVVVGYLVLTAPDQRTVGERIGDAADAVDRGESLDKAAQQLEKRTPGEKLGDAVKDATDNK